MRSLRAFVPVLVVSSLGVMVTSVAGCHRAPAVRTKAVASVFPVYDLVRRIAGPDADVTLVKPGDAAVAEATVRVQVGLGLDAWMDAIPLPAGVRVRVLRVGDRVPTIPAKDGAIDPHVWMDPQRARLIVTAIGEDLARSDASHASAFRERAAGVDASLDALDHEIDARAAAWKSRAVTTDDIGMAYYGERYHLDVVGPIGPAGPNAAKPGGPHVALDSNGGGASAATYEGLLRADTAALDSALR